MARKANIAKAIMGDENSKKIGTFKESTGGGTPLKKGEKLKDHPEAKRVQQPRDENGQFTYNAANAKPLKYGPSRGDTIPPYLRGVDLTAIVKKNNAIVYNGLTYLANMKMSAQQILDRFKEWDGNNFKGMNNDVIAKKGRKSNLEKEAIAQNKQGIVATKDQKTETTPKSGNITKLSKQDFIEKLTGKKQKVNKNVIFKDIVKKEVKAEEPKQTEVKPEVKSEESIKGGFDATAAKNNPKQYFENNKDMIKEMMSVVPGLKAGTAVAIIAKGQFKNIDEFKEYVKNNKK